MGLRIGIVTPRYPPSVGGLEEAVAAQAQALADRGHDIEVLTQVNDRRLTRPPARVGDAEVPAGPAGPEGSTGTPGPVTVHRYWSITGSERYPVAPGLWPGLRARATGRTATGTGTGTAAPDNPNHRTAAPGYDVVHAHHFHSAAALAVLGLPAGIPVVYTPHIHGGGHTAGARLLHRFYGPVSHRLFARADRVVCVSQAEADVVEAMFPGTAPKTEVVHNGLRVRAVPAAPHDGRTAPLLLSVGRLEHYKRQDLAIRALAHLPGWELAVIGAGPAAGDLQDLAARLGLSDRVHFPGRVSDEDLGGWLGRAWAFISMSEKEAFGLTLLEAAAWGIPVVASDIPAHAEVAAMVPGAVDLVTIATDTSALAGSVASAAKPMTEVALRPWADDLSWANVGRSLEAVYRSLVEPAPSSHHDIASRPTPITARH